MKAAGKIVRWAMHNDDGDPGTYTVVGFSRSDQISMTASKETVEPTKDDTSLIPEVLDQSGTVEVTGSFSGAIETTSITQIKDVIDTLYTGAVVKMQFTWAGQVISGNWSVTSFNLEGARDGSQEWSCDVQASGALTFTDV